MAGRPPKSASVIQMEGRSHRTKQELASRAHAEEAQLTGQRIREETCVKEDSVAHKEFLRVTRILTAIGKNDEAYGSEINTYCMLKSELDAEVRERDALRRRLDYLMEQSEDLTEFEDIAMAEKLMGGIRADMHRCEQRIEQKRKMRIQIDDKNLMNVMSSLRSIPKTVEKKKNPLAEALSG